MDNDATPREVGSTEGLCSTAQPVERFIDPAWIRASDWPTNIIPAGAIAINQASENGDCTVKGFYDPATGEFHIQEVLHNVRAEPRAVGESAQASG